MKGYSCIIIEDEPLAQNVLRKYIEDHPSLELVAVCADALEAQAVLGSQAVQIIFLDINLPKLSGISFLKTITAPPKIIFTTAYPEFAVEGFELNAVDYLLKPFSFERFLKAVNKALLQLNTTPHTARPGDMMKHGSVFLKADKKIYKVDLSSILYIEAVGDYIKVVSETGQLLVNETMKQILEELPAKDFIRVHKSYIIASGKIKFIEGNSIRIADKSIPIGATYRDDVFASIEKKTD